MKLVILFSKGGLGDVGRHAVRAALDRPDEIHHITVLSQHSQSLMNENWNCACEPSIHKFTDDEKKRLTIIPIDTWDEKSLAPHFEGAGAVISCLGNRQMTLGDRVGGVGSEIVVKSMNQYKIERAVVISSPGIGDDWPPLEFAWPGKIMSCIFMTCGRSDYKDLTKVETAFQTARGINYLLVRPVGLGEDIVPEGCWHVQKEKFKDKSLSFNLAKLDCARFMVDEALNPIRNRTAVVVGSPLEKA